MLFFALASCYSFDSCAVILGFEVFFKSWAPVVKLKELKAIYRYPRPEIENSR